MIRVLLRRLIGLTLRQYFRELQRPLAVVLLMGVIVAVAYWFLAPLGIRPVFFLAGLVALGAGIYFGLWRIADRYLRQQRGPRFSWAQGGGYLGVPGLAGMSASCRPSRKAEVKAMIGAMRHQPGYVSEVLYEEPDLSGSRIHLGITGREPQPHCSADLVVWVEGEIYASRSETVSRTASAAGTVADVFRASGAAGFATLDGAFAAAVWERRHRRLHLVTDRYGSRQLFWTRVGNGIAWASESKAFLRMPGFEPRIDSASISQFLAIGYLLGQRTWFEDVELVPSGSVLTCDTRSSAITVERYWWWDKIARSDDVTEAPQLADEIADLFRQAVRRRCLPGEPVGILLSGGLDSRALLAAASETHAAIPTLTFGRAGCADIKLAARAAAVARAPHHVCLIDAVNWLAPRLAGVWWSEAGYSLLHMHGMEARQAVRDLFSINLNGFAGDLILGGSYVHDENVLDRFDATYVAKVMRCDPEMLGDTSDFERMGRVDYYFLNNRVRRFTQMGTVNWLTIVQDRQPFLDADLLDFVYSLPDALRFKGRLYESMLLRSFPDYYRRIPRQATGKAIGSPWWRTSPASIFQRGSGRAMRAMPSLTPLLAGGSNVFHNYDAWLRQEPARSFVDALLKSRDSLLWDHVDPQVVQRDLQAFGRRKVGAESVLRYATLEVWLRQVFTGEYRPPAHDETQSGSRRES